MSEAEGAVETAQPTTTSWYPEEYAETVTAKGWKEPADALKSYSEMEKYVGKVKSGGLQLPDELGNEDVSQIYSRLGRPESPDKYDFNAPDGVELDNDLLGQFKQYAHTQNLTGAQFKSMVQFQIDATNAALEAQQTYQMEAKEAAAKALKETWKENYDANFKKAKETAVNLDLLDVADELGLSDDPRFIQKMLDLSSKLSEDTLRPKPKNAEPDRGQKIKELASSEAFRNAGHPDHKKVMKEFMQLHGIS